MTFTYTFNRMINDISQLQLYIKSNDFLDLLFINYDNSNYNIDCVFDTELNETQQTNLQNLITSYTNVISTATNTNMVSVLNSTNTIISPNASFMGTYENVLEYNTVCIIINSDVKGILNVYGSTDGINNDVVRSFNYSPNNMFYEIITISGQYIKIEYKNDTYTQTYFRLQSIYNIHKTKNEYDTSSVPYITIQEENIKTGGYFRSHGYSLDIPPNTIVTKDISYKYDISPLVLKFKTLDIQGGDIINLYLAPNTTIGYITGLVSSGSNILPVSASVIKNINRGFLCKITNGVNTEDLGEVYNITQGCLLTENTVANSYSTGSLIQITINNIKNLVLGASDSFKIGDSKIGASYLPANTIARMSYNNTSTSASKIFTWQIEYLY